MPALLVLAALMIALAACGKFDDRESILNTKIAFKSDRDGNEEIYVMNADGTEQTRITDNQADDTDPTWSPDGRRIAFLSDRDGNREIYVMNADGNEQTRLTMNLGFYEEPEWSPFIR